MNKLEYNRLLELKNIIDKDQASSEEKRNFLHLLLKNGSITKDQYNSYLNNQNKEEILNAAVTIGGIILVGWLVREILA